MWDVGGKEAAGKHAEAVDAGDEPRLASDGHIRGATEQFANGDVEEAPWSSRALAKAVTRSLTLATTIGESGVARSPSIVFSDA